MFHHFPYRIKFARSFRGLTAIYFVNDVLTPPALCAVRPHSIAWGFAE
jgi:hypothetical protein